MSRLELSAEEQPAPRTDHLTTCFSVSAAAEVSVMPRVMGVFSKLSIVPDHWHSRVNRNGAEELVIDIQSTGLCAKTAEHVAQVLRQIIYVDRVLMTQVHRV